MAERNERPIREAFYGLIEPRMVVPRVLLRPGSFWGGPPMPVDTRGALVLRLFEEYYERVYFFARRTVDPVTAEDIAQEVFVRLLDKDDIESRPISVSYLIKIADNLMKRRHCRLKKLERFIDAELGRRVGSAFEPAPTAAEPESSRGLMQDLSSDEQDAVRLIVCEGLSYEAAAASLDTKVSSVNNWKYRGVQKLRHQGRHGTGRPMDDDLTVEVAGVHTLERVAV